MRQLGLDHIPKQNLQSLLLRLPLHSLRHLRRHSGIQLDGDDLLRLLQYPHGQVPRTGTDLENHIFGFEVRFCDDGFCDSRVLEDVLADIGVLRNTLE